MRAPKHLLTAGIVLCFPLVSLAGSETGLSMSDTSRTNLEQEFSRLTAGLNRQDKNTPSKKWKTLANLLDRCGDATRQAEIDRITTQPIAVPATKFDDLLTQVLLDRSLRTGDSALLTRLLTLRCPNYVGGYPVEFWLARSEGTHAVLLLATAFSDARTNASPRVLVGALTRAFPGLRREFHVDRDFVAACERWARANPANCALNFGYPYLPSGPVIRPEGDPVFQVGLFVPQDREATRLRGPGVQGTADTNAAEGAAKSVGEPERRR